MAFNLGTISANVTLFTSGFNAGVKQVLAGFSSMSKSAASFSAGFGKGVNTTVSGFSKLGRAAIAANQSIELFNRFMNGVVGRIKDVGESFLDTAADLEVLKLSLDTVTKGEGEKWFKELNEWAIKMPINTKAAIGAFQLLRAMGMQPVIGDMTTLIDATSALGGSKDTLEGISRAIGQISTKGRVHLQELYQLAERGVPVFEILSKYTTLTKEQIADIGRYGIEAKPVVEVIMRAMQDMYGGQSEKMMHTYRGLVEGLIGLWTEFQRVVMDSGPLRLIETTLETITEKIDYMRARGEFDQFAQELGESAEAAIQWVVEFGEKAWKNREEVKQSLKDFKKGFEDLWHPIGVVIDGVSSLTLGLANLFRTLPTDIQTGLVYGVLGAWLFGGQAGLVIGAVATVGYLLNTLRKDVDAYYENLEKKQDTAEKKLAVQRLRAQQEALIYGNNLGTGDALGAMIGGWQAGQQFDKEQKEAIDAARNGAKEIVSVYEAAAGQIRKAIPKDPFVDIAMAAQGLGNAMKVAIPQTAIDSAKKMNEEIEEAARALKAATPEMDSYGVSLKEAVLADAHKKAADEVALLVRKWGELDDQMNKAFDVPEDTLRVALIQAIENGSNWVLELENIKDGTTNAERGIGLLDDSVKGIAKTMAANLGLVASFKEELSGVGTTDLWLNATKIKGEPQKIDVGAASKSNANQIYGSLQEKIKGLNLEYAALTSGLSSYGIKLIEIDTKTQDLLVKYQKQIAIIPELEKAIREFGEAQKRVLDAQDVVEWQRQYKKAFGNLDAEITILLQRIHNGFGDMWEEIQKIAQDKKNLEIDVDYKFSTKGIENFTGNMRERVQLAMDLLIEKLDISARKAAGIVGSFMNENAQLDPTLWQKGTSESSHVLGLGKAGFGITQLTSKDRQLDFKNFAGEHINDLKTQVLFAIHELQTTEKNALDEILKAADDEKIVARITTDRFERPGIAHKDDAGAATRAYSMYGGSGATGSPEVADAMTQTQMLAQAMRQADLNTEESKKRLIVYLRTILDLEQQVKSAELSAAQAGMTEREKLFSSIDDAQKKALADIQATTAGMENMGWVTDSVIERFNKLKELSVSEKLGELKLQIDDAKFQNSLIGLNEAEKIIAETNEQMRLWGSTTDEVAQKLRGLGEIRLEGIGKSIVQNIQDIYRFRNVLKESFTAMEGPLTDFFAKFAETGKASFQELGAALVKQLQMLAAQKTAHLLMEAAYHGVMIFVDPTNSLIPGSTHAAAALAALQGAAIMGGFVAGSGLGSMMGMAHHGIDSIPEDGTWLLKKKERVVDAKTNQDLKQYLTENKDGNRPNVTIAPVFHNSDEQGVLKALPQLKQMIIDTVHGDIAGNGSIRHAVINYT